MFWKCYDFFLKLRRKCVDRTTKMFQIKQILRNFHTFPHLTCQSFPSSVYTEHDIALSTSMPLKLLALPLHSWIPVLYFWNTTYDQGELCWRVYPSQCSTSFPRPVDPCRDGLVLSCIESLGVEYCAQLPWFTGGDQHLLRPACVMLYVTLYCA